MRVLFNPKETNIWWSLLRLSGVTRASAVRPVSSPPRHSRRSCRKVSPAHASPPTTASPRSVGPRSALDVGCWRVARPWSSTETAGDTWSPLHWTVPRPGSGQPIKIHPDSVRLSSGVKNKKKKKGDLPSLDGFTSDLYHWCPGQLHVSPPSFSLFF